MQLAESNLDVAAAASTIAGLAVVLFGGFLYALGSLRPVKLRAATYSLTKHIDGVPIGLVQAGLKSRTRNAQTISMFLLIEDPGWLRRWRLWTIATEDKKFFGSSIPDEGKVLAGHDVLALRGELRPPALPFGEDTLCAVLVGNRPFVSRLKTERNTAMSTRKFTTGWALLLVGVFDIAAWLVGVGIAGDHHWFTRFSTHTNVNAVVGGSLGCIVIATFFGLLAITGRMRDAIAATVLVLYLVLTITVLYSSATLPDVSNSTDTTAPATAAAQGVPQVYSLARSLVDHFTIAFVTVMAAYFPSLAIEKVSADRKTNTAPTPPPASELPAHPVASLRNRPTTP
jgi:hypothetical protein